MAEETLREIRKKMVILKNHMPFSADRKSSFRKIEGDEWLWRNVRLEGTGLSRGQVEAAASGEIVLGGSVGEHLLLAVVNALPDKLWAWAGMKREPDLNLIAELAGETGAAEDVGSRYGAADAAVGAEKAGYRRRNLVIHEFNYTPPLPAEIPGRMEEAGKALVEAVRTEAASEECFICAARIHNMIAEISPYGRKDRLLARSVAAYYLIFKGYPLVTFDMSESAYNKMIEIYIRTGRNEDCAAALAKAVLERLRLMARLTGY